MARIQVSDTKFIETDKIVTHDLKTHDIIEPSRLVDPDWKGSQVRTDPKKIGTRSTLTITTVDGATHKVGDEYFETAYRILYRPTEADEN